MQASPEKKATTARKIKAATGTKAKVTPKIAKPGTTIKAEHVSSGAEGTATASPPLVPVIPPVGTHAYWDYMRAQYRAEQVKRRIAKKKKLEQEDTIFAKDIEDSEDEWNPKKAKKSKTKTKQEQALADARSTGCVSSFVDCHEKLTFGRLDLYFTKGTKGTKGAKKRDKTCYFFKLPREVRDSEPISIVLFLVYSLTHSSDLRVRLRTEPQLLSCRHDQEL